MYGKDRFCPAYNKIVDFEVCYESALVLAYKLFIVSSVPELSEIKDIDAATIICKNCPFSDME